MKNIVFLTYLNIWSMDKNKGAPSFFKTLEAYINDGWNVILIHPQYNNGVTPKLNGVKNITFKPIFYPFVGIKKVSFFARILHSIYGNRIFYTLGKRVLKELNNQALIYAYEVHGVNGGNLLKNKFGLPFVTRFQGTVLDPVKNNWINRLKFYPHFGALKKGANITIMTDDGTHGNKVLKRLNNNSGLVEFWKNGVDIKIDAEKNIQEIEDLKKSLGLKANDRVLLTVSRLAPWKKVNRAIEALAIVLKERANVKLIIVGDGDEKLNLMELSKKLNISSNVIFTGAIPQTDVKNYLNLADIFLSLYDLSNVGNPLLEAMSSGRPIITLNVGETEKLIKNEINGIILNKKDIKKIPAYIIKILDDDSFAKKIGNNAKEYAENNFWSWNERMKAELESVNLLYENWNFKK